VTDAELNAALETAAGPVSEQMEAATALVAHLADRRAAAALLHLLRHPSNLGPICEAANALMANGTDAALRLFAIAWHQTEAAEDWQRADCLADAAREAVGDGTVQVARWKSLSAVDDPAVRAGAESVWMWLTEGMGAPG
jgi:hypothetical protein